MTVSGKETILRLNSRHLDSAGLSDDAKANSIAIIGNVLDLCAQQAREKISAPIDIDSLIATSWADIPAPIIASLKSAQKVRAPWFDTFLTINPRPILPSITCPVLVLNGDKDTQVNTSTNTQAIRETLPQAKPTSSLPLTTSSNTPPPAKSQNTPKYKKPSPPKPSSSSSSSSPNNHPKIRVTIQEL